MAKDDYFKLVYAILTELYESKKSGTKVPPDAIHPERFGIPVSYWLDSMEGTSGCRIHRRIYGTRHKDRAVSLFGLAGQRKNHNVWHCVLAGQFQDETDVRTGERSQRLESRNVN